MASHPNNCWEAPKFNSPHQLEDWKVFYTRALDYLEALDMNTDEADDWHTGWKQLKMMFEGEDRLSSPLLIMGPSLQSTRRCPRKPLVLLAALSKLRSISGISGMSFSLMSANSLMRVFMPCPPIYPPLSQSAISPMPKPRRCLKLWFCNMPCNTMRPETGSISRTSPS